MSLSVRYDLVLDAIRLDYLFRETPCVLASNAKIDYLPHQIQAVKSILDRSTASDGSSVRLMIADDVGLGKTIITGLAIRELMLRGRVARVLVVVPKSLLNQWYRELKEKFDIEATVVARGKDLEKMDLKKINVAIVSIDLIKRDSILPKFREAGWDLVIFDEAHNLTVREEGSRIVKTKRYAAAEELALLAPNVLLLTATPHHGKFMDFVYRLRLLDPSIPVDKSLVRNVVRRYVIRRLREEVNDEEGRPLVPPGESTTVPISLSGEEYEFYEKVSKYVYNYFNTGFKKESKAYIFVAYVFQKRASSSIYAIMKTLKRRANRLEEILKLIESGKLEPKELERKIAELTDKRKWKELLKNRRWKELLKYIVLEPTPEGIRRELDEVKKLVELSETLLKEKTDTKFDKLLEVLRNAGEDKAIVFTQFRDTLEYLVSRLNEMGFRVTYIHGGMKLNERIDAERALKEEAKVLVATDAASEGLNLQVANILVNYDLPWNPTRLDQRIGRVHRYGQKKKVHVYNFLVRDTIDDHVYEVLLNKIDEIRRDLKKVYDYLGVYVTEDDFRELVTTYVEKPEELEKKAEEIVKKGAEKARELEDLLERNRIRLLEDPRCKPEDTVYETDVEEFVKSALGELCPQCITPVKGKEGVYELRPPSLPSNKSLNELYVKEGSFRKEVAEKYGVEYVGLGHPLVQYLVDYVKNSVKTPLVLEAENTRTMGWLALIRLTAETSDEVPIDIDRGITRRIARSKVVAVLFDEVRNQYYVAPLSIIKELLAYREGRLDPETISQLVSYARQQFGDVRGEVEREFRLIKESIAARYNAEISSIPRVSPKKAKELVEKYSMHMQSLNAIEVVEREPEVIAVLRLVPVGYFELGMERSERILEIGKIGEKIAKAFEESRGCNVKDFRDVFVAGFDFLSFCPDGVRYIEVKTVSGSWGKIYIKKVEWEFMRLPENDRKRRVKYWVREDVLRERLERLKDSIHLYVVNLETGQLIDIRNPGANLWRFFTDKYKKDYFNIEIPYKALEGIEDKEVHPVRGLIDRVSG